MSVELRKHLQDTLIFQSPDEQRHQLTEVGANGADFAIDTDLISVMYDMQKHGIKFVITALRDDHRYDGCLGPYNHNPAGKAMDFWILNSSVVNDYADPASLMFVSQIEIIKAIQYVDAIGLGGSAQTATLLHSLGDLGFMDNGADHIHVQVR